MIHEFNKPIPCNTPIGDAYAIYVKSNGMFEDDEWCCVMCEEGQVRHFTSSQIKIWQNATYGIHKKIDMAKIFSEALKK